MQYPFHTHREESIMVSKGKAVSRKAASAPAVVVPRENPVARLERLLEETRVKEAAKAEAQLPAKYEARERAINQIERWERIRDEVTAKIDELHDLAWGHLDGGAEDTPASVTAEDEAAFDEGEVTE